MFIKIQGYYINLRNIDFFSETILVLCNGRQEVELDHGDYIRLINSVGLK